MALHNPSNLYSEGNVVFDSTPYMKIALQQQAKKQAQEEAANQYFDKLPEKLNMAGVRTQDLEDPEGNGGILKDINDWRLEGIQNRADINKGGMARVKHMAKFDRIMQNVNKSKGIGKEELETGKAALSTNGWKPREEDHPVIEAMSKSIYNPKHYKDDGVSQYSRNDLSLAAAPYSAEKQNQFDKNVLGGIKPQLDTNTPPVLDETTNKVFNTYKYRPEDIYNAGQQAAQAVKSDETMRYHYDDLLHDPDAIKTASEMLSKVAGVPVVATTPEQMAAGLKMKEVADKTEQKEETNVAAANAFRKKLQDERLAASMARTKLVQRKKDERLKAMQDYNLDDVYGHVSEKLPVENIKGPAGFNKNYVDITTLTDAEREDFLGKPIGQDAKNQDSEHPTYKHEPIKIGDKIYVEKTDNGTLVGKDGVAIDPDQTLANTFARMGKIKKPIGKGELKINETIKPVTQQQKTTSLNATHRRGK